MISLTLVKQEKECIVIFEGDLDESTTALALTNSIRPCLEEHPECTLVFDMFGLKSGNSSGLMELVRALAILEGRVVFERLPSWLVWQFNMIGDLSPCFQSVRSIVGDFICHETQETLSVLLVIGEDIPLLATYETFSMPARVINGHTYEPDFDDTFFYFLSLHFHTP